METNIDSSINLTGMSNLLNTDLISKDIEPNLIESDLINNTKFSELDNDNILNSLDDDFNKIMELSSEIDHNEYNINDVPSRRSSIDSINYDNMDYNINSDITLDSILEDNDISKSPSMKLPTNNPSTIQSVPPVVHSTKSTHQFNNAINVNKYSDDFSEFNNVFSSVTKEPELPKTENNRFKDTYNDNSTIFNNISLLESTNIDDRKISLLSRIEELKEDLRNQNEDISRIKEVNYDSSFEEIEHTFRVLLIKNTRDRYRSIAEDSIIAFTHLLEKIFDGKKEYFGTHPDLVGFSQIVKTKLRRLHYETSQIAGNAMEKYELSPSMKLFIALVPSAFLYSARKKRSIGNYEDAIDDIRDYE